MSSEATLQRAIRKEIEARGGMCLKIHGSPYTKAGSPDLLGALNGTSFALEVKVGSNKPTLKQLHELAAWNAQGWATGIAHSVEEALQIVSRETF